MPSLEVALVVPIPSRRYVGTRSLIFSRWLPTGETDVLERRCGALTVRLSFEPSCTWYGPMKNDEDYERQVNVLAYRVHAHVEVEDVAADLVEHISARGAPQRVGVDTQNLQTDYRRLAGQVYSATVETVNRLLDYARHEKGQFWIDLYAERPESFSDFFRSCGARARGSGDDWFPFATRFGSHGYGVMAPPDRYLREADWKDAQDYVSGTRRSDLTRTLLAGADVLAASGHPRSTLTEAVTALEVAVNTFARNAQTSAAARSMIGGRSHLAALKDQVDHLGLSGTVRYLLPVLFTEAQLPGSVITACSEAIGQRQNVVHNGQRSVNPDTLTRSLAGIREMCLFLEAQRRNPSAMSRRVLTS